MTSVTQGGKGNTTGNTLERTVESILLAKGFKLISPREWENLESRLAGDYLVRNAPFTTVYGHKGKTEFLMQSPKLSGPTRVECKWQQSSGSVDEKLPYLYLNCLEAMPESNIIILIDGGGWKPGSLQWLRESVSQKKFFREKHASKNIWVFSLSDFITWANNTLS